MTALMQAHLRAIPFENLDVQLGVPVSTKPEDAFAKVVERNRGGWCFELNGLFKWLLTEIGFEVRSLAGFVGRKDSEPPLEPSHLFLRVDCEEPMFVDVGFGGSLFAPIPIGTCQVEQLPYTLTLGPIDDEYFRWTEKAHGSTSSVDFTLSPVEPDFFDAISHRLQTDPASPFVQNLTAQRRFADKHIILRGLVKRTIDAKGTTDEVLKSSHQLVECLSHDFRLNVPEIVKHWEKLTEKHVELFGV